MSGTKKAAFQILEFLNSAIKDGSVKEDDKEGLEVAAQCISEAFGVDLASTHDAQQYSIAPDTLVSLLDKHVQVQPEAAEPEQAAAPATAEQKAAAEKAKASGNQAMAKKDYQGAIRSYGEAIEHDAGNAVYWSNRAAAHSQLSAHDAAISDAKQALKIDPTFSKAYSRLGHAQYSSGHYRDAVEAYEKGLEMDPNNATMKASLATAKSRVPADDDDEQDGDDDETSGVSARGAPAGGMPAFPGMPGMGGAGGMPDLAGLMSNPAIMQMAQQMMGNGGMEQLMNNPMLRQMMSGMGGGAGGMPDMSALMNDPTMRAMAEQMGAGMGRGGAGGASGSDADGSNADMYS
ncbi:hypothetical protein RQP46_007593 [Phenoliferia psychrophenolica]